MDPKIENLAIESLRLLFDMCEKTIQADNKALVDQKIKEFVLEYFKKLNFTDEINNYLKDQEESRLEIENPSIIDIRMFLLIESVRKYFKGRGLFAKL